MMKAFGPIIVSFLGAASTVALSYYTCNDDLVFSPSSPQSKYCGQDAAKLGDGKYAPRFDGLKFIETLVTAHR